MKLTDSQIEQGRAESLGNDPNSRAVRGYLEQFAAAPDDYLDNPPSGYAQAIAARPESRGTSAHIPMSRETEALRKAERFRESLGIVTQRIVPSQTSDVFRNPPSGYAAGLAARRAQEAK